MFKRIFSVIMVLAVVVGLLPSVAIPKADAAPSASTATVTSLFEARSEGVHPRIFANKDDFTRIRKLVETDPYMKALYTRIYNYSVEILAEPVLTYDIPDGKRLLTVCNNATNRITWLAMAYQISGESRFADRAVKEMLNVCAFKDWNPSHYLDTAQMSFGVGLGYDWLYHYMTASQRKTVMNGIYKHGVSTQQTTQSGMTAIHNWNPWCNGGLSVAAAAIFEDHPSECAAILSNAVTNIQKSMLYAPSGAYPEGPDYSGVGLGFTVYLINTLETVLGTDFGLSEIRGMKESGNFPIATNGYLYTFNWGDGAFSLRDSAVLHWYANRYNMPELSLYQREMQTNNGRFDVFLSLVWYNPDLVEGKSFDDRQTDYLIMSDEYESIASFRSFPGDAHQIYAAIKSGSNQTNHTDLDIGTFVMEAMGVAWFEELGKDNYNLPNYMSRTSETSGRWTYYRKRTEGQNTLVINPTSYGGQDVDAKCQITDYQSGYDGGYATVNMKNAYDGCGATSVKRSLALFDNRTRVRLRDEITCSSASTIYWFAHTKAKISISADGKTATLTRGGKTLLAQIASPDNAKFTQMDAKPLSSSPNPSGQNANEGYRKLVVKLTKATSASITVFFTPVLDENDTGKSLPTWGIANTGKLLNEYDPTATLTPNSEGVYEIYDAEQLCLLSKMVSDGNTFSGKTVRLMADIDLKSRSFRPIGGNGSGYAFSGTFDGNGHTVKNLLVFAPSGEGVGFFGNTKKATIQNFGIESGMVFGGKASAGLTGYGSNVTIKNCFNRANVISSGGYSGGLVGQLGGTSTITASYNNAYVKSSGSIAGGIAGYISSSSTIELNGCYHVGSLSDSTGKTGMIGFYNTGSTNPISKITVKNCRSTAAIKSSEIADNTALESYSGNGKRKAAQMVTAAHGMGSAYIYDCDWINDGYPVLTWQSKTALPEDLVLTTAPQLRLVAFLVNSGKDSFSGKTIRLGRDIDLDSREWTPIGGNNYEDAGGKSFKGTFDGQGYTVSNLKISTNYYYVGFFGTSGGTVKNFGITSGSVKGANKTGGLCGSASGTISNCFSRATVEGTTNAGGLVGMAGKLSIENSYAKGSVTATGNAGGLVAYYASNGAGSKITNSYAACSVSGKYEGGLVCSINSAITDIAITNSYALSGPSLVYATTGYTLKSSSSQSATNLKAKAGSLGNAFRLDSYIPKNSGYPVLTVNTYKSPNMTALEPNAEGVYEIRTAQELRRLAYMVNEQGLSPSGKTVRLLADIDLENEEWIPIGGNASADGASKIVFTGTFDGNGHTVSNLSVSEGNYYVGFFGDLSKAVIQNFGIESGMVTGEGKVGGLAGTIRGGVTILNCYNKASVCGKAAVGGIVGMASGADSTIENCYNAGSTGGNGSAAGIVGYYSGSATNTTVKNCFNTGKVKYGIVGSASADATGTLSNSYTVDTVEVVGTTNALVLTGTKKVSAADLRGSVATLGTAFAEDYFASNRLFPVLAWQNGDRSNTLPQKDGVYQISSADELRLLAYMVRKGTDFKGQSVELTADIDLGNRVFLPIGGKDETSNYYFRGTFDGKGHVIRNLNVMELDLGYGGLFGYATGAVIQNVGIESGTVMGYTRSAAIASIIQKGTIIRNCYNKAMVYADSDSGAFAAMVSGSDCILENCYNMGIINAEKRTTNTAGLIGYLASDAHNTIIRNCYNVGNYYGLLGVVNESTTGAITENCYSVGTVILVRTKAKLSMTATEQISGETLKGYASVLGSAYQPDVQGINKGYPVLTWQNASHCFHSYETVSDGSETHSTVCTLCGDKTTELISGIMVWFLPKQDVQPMALCSTPAPSARKQRPKPFPPRVTPRLPSPVQMQPVQTP
ncbi:MAG: heparinase II/III family protein, partial [Oscillospiraceae bacterium]|nr:heparinase II/III family protein [Oscillospiraceae bacterium]